MKKHKHEKLVFEIRDIERPCLMLNGNYLVRNITIGLTKEEFKSIVLTLGFQNFQYTIKNIDPISFDVIWPDKTSVTLKGNKLDKKSIKKLHSLSIGSIITIDNITLDMGGACGPGFGPVMVVLIDSHK